MFRFVTLVGVLGGVGSAMAEPVRMTSDDIKRAMVPGTLLEIDTPLGTSIPVTVSSNGIVSGDAGALGLTLGAVKDRGRWWTDADKLCVKWFRWFDAKPRCMVLKRDGNRVQWYEGSGESGTATLTVAAPTIVAAAPAPAPRQAPRAPTPVADPPQVETAEETDANPPARFASAALTGMLEKPKPVEQPMAKLGATAPAKADEPVSQPRKIPEAKRAKPATEAASPAPRRPRAPAAAVRIPKEPYRHEPTFRVSGVDVGDKLNVRSGPSEFHKPVGAIPADARKVRITGTCRELWCPVRHGHLEGWVNRYYLAEDVASRATASSKR